MVRNLTVFDVKTVMRVIYTLINQSGELWGLLEFNKFNKTAF